MNQVVITTLRVEFHNGTSPVTHANVNSAFSSTIERISTVESEEERSTKSDPVLDLCFRVAVIIICIIGSAANGVALFALMFVKQVVNFS
jgi:hypothetical protein